MEKVVLLFPGQGAQYKGMGKDFYDTFPLAKQTFEEADDLLKIHLSRLIFEGDEETLKQTKNSQLAIFIVSSAILKVVSSLRDLTPFAVSGLSLGEYTALFASGKASFAQVLDLISYRANYMDEACETKAGEMAVILGLEDDDVRAFVREASLPNDLFVANFNCPGQVVISGTKKGIEIGSKLAKERGAKKVLSLAVQGAFHSGLMNEAKLRLKPHIEELSLKKTDIKIVMNVVGDFVSEENEIKKYLINQVTEPVLWHQGIIALEKAGATKFIEIGCGKTLTGFNKRLGLAEKTLNFEKVTDLVGGV